MEVPHQHRVGVGTGDRTQDVVGALHVGDPITDRFAGGVFEGGGAGGHRLHRGTQQPHAEHIEGLPTHVLGAHVNHAFEPETGADRGGGHPMLASAGLGDDPLLAHTKGKQSLAQGVIDLVGTGVVQVFALEPDARSPLGAAVVLAQPLGFIKRAGSADIGAQELLEPSGERRILPGFSGRSFQLGQGRHQCLRHVLTAVATKAAETIGARRCLQGFSRRHGASHRRWVNWGQPREQAGSGAASRRAPVSRFFRAPHGSCSRAAAPGTGH